MQSILMQSIITYSQTDDLHFKFMARSSHRIQETLHLQFKKRLQLA